MAEARAREAITGASRAVTDYKESTDFGADVASASIDLFFLGFQECKLKVAVHFPSVDLSGILPPREEGEEEEYPGDEGGEGTVEVEAIAGQAAEVPAQAIDPEVIVQMADPEVSASIVVSGVKHAETPAPHNCSGVPPAPSELAREEEVVADP